MLLLSCLSLVMLAGVSGISAEAKEEPLLTSSFFSSSPQIDGRLNEPCWQEAITVPLSLLFDGSGFATEKTQVKVGYDKENLYFGFECFETKLHPRLQQTHLIQANKKQHDSAIWEDDSIELFISPPNQDYYHFCANTLGTQYEAKVKDKSWDGKWQVKTSLGKESWVAEIAIPFKALGGEFPKERELWRLNLCREEQPKKEYSSWSCTFGGFHKPEKFGYLVFGKDELVMTDVISLGNLEIGRNSIELKVVNPDKIERTVGLLTSIKYQEGNPATNFSSVTLKGKEKRTISTDYVITPENLCLKMEMTPELEKVTQGAISGSFPVKPNTPYLCSAHVKAKGLKGNLEYGLSYSVSFRDKDGASIGPYIIAVIPPADCDWTKIEKEIVTPPGAVTAWVWGLLKWANKGITGTVWVDDITMKEKGTEINLIPNGSFDEGKKGWNIRSKGISIDKGYYEKGESFALNFSLFDMDKGKLLYRSPSYSGKTSTKKGEIKIAASIETEYEIYLNGEKIEGGSKEGIKKYPLPFRIGENVLAIKTLSNKDNPWLAADLSISGEIIKTDKRWKYSPQVDKGWNNLGYDDLNWEHVKELGKSDVKQISGSSIWSLSKEKEIYLRRTIVLGDEIRFRYQRRELLFPQKSSQVLYPLLEIPSKSPFSDYQYVIEVPEYFKLIDFDPMNGIATPNKISEERIKREGKDYCRYILNFPKGRLGGIGIDIYMRFGDPLIRTGYYVPVITVGGTFDWEKIEEEVISPPTAANGTLWLLKWARKGVTGTVWFDDISIKEEGTDINLIQNGSFEQGAKGWRLNQSCSIVEREVNGKKGKCLKIEAKLPYKKVAICNGGFPIKKPGTKYIITALAKSENTHSEKVKPFPALLFKLGEIKQRSFNVYTYFQANGGNITEIARKTKVNVLPPLLGKRPKKIPVIFWHSPSSGVPEFNRHKVVEAIANNIANCGGNYLSYGDCFHVLADVAYKKGVKPMWSGCHWRGGYMFSNGNEWNEFQKKYPEVNCPSYRLESLECQEKLEHYIAAVLQRDRPGLAMWDHESPPSSHCFCERCLKKFRKFAKLPEDVVLTRDIILEKYEDKWIDFRCLESAKTAGMYREMVHRAGTNTKLAVYSGYQSEATKKGYGVDWEVWGKNCDLATAGYGHSKTLLENTASACGKTPFAASAFYNPGDWKLWEREGGNPTQPKGWKISLLRTFLYGGGKGVTIWCIPFIDAGGFYYTSEVTAIIADFEDIFLKGKRDESLVKADCPSHNIVVFTKGKERLVILFNGSNKEKKVTLTNLALPNGMVAKGYYTEKVYKNPKEISLTIPSNDVSIVHLFPMQEQ